MWPYLIIAVVIPVLLAFIPRTAQSRPLWGQLCVVSAPLALLFGAACLSQGVRPEGVGPPWLQLLATLFFFGFSLARYLMLARKQPPQRAAIHWAFWVVLGLFAALQLIDINVSPVWDAGLYYGSLLKAVQSFDFTFASFLKAFSLQSHPTHMLVVLYAPAQYLLPGSVAALNATTLALSAVMLGAYYRLMQKLLGDDGMKPVFAAALFAFMPQVFAFATGINPDYGVLLGLVFLLYSYACGHQVMLVASALLLIFSKEVGVILYGGFGLGVILVIILPAALRAKSSKAFWQAALRHVHYLIPLALFFANWFWGNVGHMGSANRLDTLVQGGGLGSFHFDIYHIITVIAQVLVLNFNWLLSLTIFAGLVYWLLRTVRREHKNPFRAMAVTVSQQPVWGIFAVTVAIYLLFTLAYVDFPLARYNLATLTFLPPLAVAGFLALPVRNVPLRRALPAGMLLMYLSASYFTWDPVSRFAFPYSHSMGQVRLLEVTNNTGFKYVCERHIYNRQYLNYSRLLDDIIAEYGVDEKRPYVSFDIPEYAMQFFGNDTYDSDYLLLYSPEQNRRVFPADDAVPIPGGEWFAEDLADHDDLPGEIYWITLPYQSTQITGQMLTHYEITEQRTFSRMGMEMTVMQCSKLEQPQPLEIAGQS